MVIKIKTSGKGEVFSNRFTTPHLYTASVYFIFSDTLFCQQLGLEGKEPFIMVKTKLVWEPQTSGKLPDLELLNPNTGSPILLTFEFPAMKSQCNHLTKIVMQLVFKKNSNRKKA